MNKKFVLLTALLLFVLALFGCGQQSTDRLYFGSTQDEAEYIVTGSERKIIYTVDIEFDVNDINQAFKEIKSLLNADEWSENEYLSDISASIRVRIKSDRLDEFISSLSSVGTRTSYNKTASDITGSYEDLNVKIESLKGTLERLETLKKEAANNIGELIEIENHISQTESELKEYQKQLNSYNSQIDYSYVNIYLAREKVDEKAGFGSRIGNAFKNGWNGFITVSEFLFIGLCYILVFFSIPAVIVGIILIIVFSVKKKRRNAANKNDETKK